MSGLLNLIISQNNLFLSEYFSTSQCRGMNQLSSVLFSLCDSSETNAEDGWGHNSISNSRIFPSVLSQWSWTIINWRNRKINCAFDLEKNYSLALTKTSNKCDLYDLLPHISILINFDISDLGTTPDVKMIILTEFVLLERFGFEGCRRSWLRWQD